MIRAISTFSIVVRRSRDRNGNTRFTASVFNRMTEKTIKHREQFSGRVTHEQIAEFALSAFAKYAKISSDDTRLPTNLLVDQTGTNIWVVTLVPNYI